MAPVDESVARSRDEPAENPAVVAEDRSLVQTALAQLPEPQRRVIELAFFDGLTQSEIADPAGRAARHREDARAPRPRAAARRASRERGCRPHEPRRDRRAGGGVRPRSLEAEDRARFETLLRAGDPEAAAALREFEGTLADLAAATPETPPPAVKAALMERIAAAPPRGTRRVRCRVSAAPIWPVVLSGAMAAGLAAIVVGWSVSSTYEKRLDALARDAEQLKAELRGQQTVIAILRDPATQMVALAGQAPAPTARARMMWHAKAGGVFVAAGLPEAPAGKAYQLWAIAGDNAPVSAGVFSGGRRRGRGASRCGRCRAWRRSTRSR